MAWVILNSQVCAQSHHKICARNLATNFTRTRRKRYFEKNTCLSTRQLIFVFYFYSAFQEHTERMRKKLKDQMVDKVDNEDERIAKALAERETKREVLLNSSQIIFSSL
jgi:hypothetical protein